MLYCLGESFQKMTERLPEVKASYIEVVDDGFHTLDKKRVSMLKNIAESYDLKYSIHAPFADINIASSSDPILKAMLKRLKKSINYASELNAHTWVFHPGLRTGISMFYPQMDWLKNIESVQVLCKIASDFGLRIAIENVPEPFPFLMKSVEDFKKFYDEINREIGLVLDVGHANINGQIGLFLETFADKIVHVHAHDNDGKSDQHLGIGYGTVDWNDFADMLGKISYDKVVIIEAVEHIQESFQKLNRLFA